MNTVYTFEGKTVRESLIAHGYIRTQEKEQLPEEVKSK